MKIKENVTLYTCDHCKKKLQRKHAMELHEKWCNSNPSNFVKCTFCAHLEKTTIVIEDDSMSDFDFSRKCSAFKCNHFEKKVYPRKVLKLGLVEKYPGTFFDQMPMPKECPYFKSQLPF